MIFLFFLLFIKYIISYIDELISQNITKKLEADFFFQKTRFFSHVACSTHEWESSPVAYEQLNWLALRFQWAIVPALSQLLFRENPSNNWLF